VIDEIVPEPFGRRPSAQGRGDQFGGDALERALDHLRGMTGISSKPCAARSSGDGPRARHPLTGLKLHASFPAGAARADSISASSVARVSAAKTGYGIEGRLVDTKSYPFANTWRTRVEPGDALHEMLMRLTLDETYTVVAVEASTDASPHACLRRDLPNFQRIVGQKIGPGWNKQVKQLVGGAEGCAIMSRCWG